MPNKRPYQVNEITREVTVVTKRKGRKKPEVRSIRVTVRSTHRLDHDSGDIRDLVDKVFGPREGVHVTHTGRRQIEKK